MTAFGRVEAPYWDDKPVVIVAGGKSLAGFDWDRLRPYHVLAVKASIFDIPFSTAGFGLDVPRLMEWKDKLQPVTFPVYWAIDDKMLPNMPDIPCAIYLHRKAERLGVSDDPTFICGGGSSGYGAVNVATLKRAKTIVLMGYDYSGPFNVGAGRYRRTEQVPVFHHNEQHYKEKRKQFGENWALWARNFNAFLAVRDRVTIINASPQSAITAFPRMSIDDALGYLSRLR